MDLASVKHSLNNGNVFAHPQGICKINSGPFIVDCKSVVSLESASPAL